MIKKIATSNITYKLFYFSIVLFGLYPLVPESHESYVPILFIVSSFLVFITNKDNKKPLYKPLIIMSSVFIMFLISALLSKNSHLAFKKIETMASLIGFPVACFWFLKHAKLDVHKIKNIFFRVFFASTVVYALIAFYLLQFYRHHKFSLTDADFFRNAIIDIPVIGDHSIYVSLFLSIAIIIGFFMYRQAHIALIFKVVIVIGQLVLAAMLVLLMSKSVILALIISLLCVLIVQQKNAKKIIITGFVIIVLVAVLLPKQNNRFFELFNKESYTKVDTRNSTSIRFHVLKSALQLAFEQPIFGYGLGDVQPTLNKKYKQNKLYIKSYNNHNQYLFVWLSSGVFALMLFLYYLFYISKTALKYKDYFLLSIATLFIVTFLFENVLSRQSGVILFAFLTNILILIDLKRSQIQSSTSINV